MSNAITFALFTAMALLNGQAPAASPTATPRPTPAPTANAPKIIPGQSIYIVALDTSTRDSRMSATRLDLERKAAEQFRHEKTFLVSQNLKQANWVFVIAIDPGSPDYDELALLVSVPDYLAHNTSIEQLRDDAVWQSSDHFHRGKEAGKNVALGAATLGYGPLFRHPSVAKNLVKQFHKDVKQHQN